jgi:hypothetical protein
MTCAQLTSMFAAAAVATLFQTNPVGAQPMTETSTATTIHRGQSRPGNPTCPTGLRHPLVTTRKQGR